MCVRGGGGADNHGPSIEDDGDDFHVRERRLLAFMCLQVLLPHDLPPVWNFPPVPRFASTILFLFFLFAVKDNAPFISRASLDVVVGRGESSLTRVLELHRLEEVEIRVACQVPRRVAISQISGMTLPHFSSSNFSANNG